MGGARFNFRVLFLFFFSALSCLSFSCSNIHFHRLFHPQVCETTVCSIELSYCGGNTWFSIWRTLSDIYFLLLHQLDLGLFFLP